MERFRYATPMLLLLGILAVVVASISLPSPANNPFSNIPTLVMGVLMIAFAIILSIIARRGELEET
ncbi:MAG: hypothetical protein AM325_011365 [Candidatus Thorarchaeota archaeon SMTZ1-45]